MKVAFVRIGYHNVWEPLGIAYIIAYVKAHYMDELEVSFFDGVFKDNYLDALDCDIVAFSATSPPLSETLHVASAFKDINPYIHTVLGGWHVTGEPRIREGGVCYKHIDQIVVGEGEKAMLSILYGNREPILHGRPMLFEELKPPDRKAIKSWRYLDLCEEMCGKRIASFQAHRGCPMRCVFCSEQCMTHNNVRERDIYDLEINHVDCNYFKFVDPTFDVNPQWVMDFCRLKRVTGNILPWEAMIHAQFATERMLKEMGRAQCNQINIGVESGSPRILKDMKKGVSIRQIKNTFRWAKEVGIKRRAFFMLGMPNETEKDHEFTERLIEEIEPDEVGFTILCPYPGSPIYSDKFKDVDWSKTDEYSNDFWQTEHQSNQQLKDKQAYFVDKYKEVICARQDENDKWAK